MSEEQGKEGQEWEWEFEEDFPYKYPGYGDIVALAPDGMARVLIAGNLKASEAERLIADHNAARDDKARMFLMRFQLRTAWFNLGCRCIFDDEHNKLAEDPHCPYHGFASDKAWESVEGFRDDGTPLLSSSPVAQGGTPAPGAAEKNGDES